MPREGIGNRQRREQNANLVETLDRSSEAFSGITKARMEYREICGARARRFVKYKGNTRGNTYLTFYLPIYYTRDKVRGMLKREWDGQQKYKEETRIGDGHVEILKRKPARYWHKPRFNFSIGKHCSPLSVLVVVFSVPDAFSSSLYIPRSISLSLSLSLSLSFSLFFCLLLICSHAYCITKTQKYTYTVVNIYSLRSFPYVSSSAPTVSKHLVYSYFFAMLTLSDSTCIHNRNQE